MLRYRLSFAVIAVAAIGLCGCTAPSRTGEPVVQGVAVQDETAQDALWEACQDVLREHRLALDHVDRRSGVITTHPETSQQFFEFWRHDVDTPYDALEATVRTVRRSAEVNVAFDETSAEATVRVTVHRERFATPERQFNNSVAAFRMFGDTLPSEATGLRITRADDYWIPDGRDIAMERYLLDTILARMGA